MAKIPKKFGPVAEIDAIEYGGRPRPYLGMSGIGGECWRKIWYGFHWVNIKKHNARLERIFDIGHLFEALAIADLKKVGCEVFKIVDGKEVELTGEVGEVQEEMIGFAGHEKGHNDGRIRGVSFMPTYTMLLELKTMNDSRFNSFKKNGVQKSSTTYYGQVQRYMIELDLQYCFFLAINKNDCSYYYEIIEIDYSFAKELQRKGAVIIMSDSPPERAYSSDNYNCNFCGHYAQCHANSEPMVNCRTCDFSDIESDGIWSCSKHNKVLDYETQLVGCDKYKKGWGL